jgi:DNA polymerase III epsilon subunit-like protein
MSKLAFIDLETTGLSPWKNGIWQIGMILADLSKDRDLVIHGRHKWEVCPTEDDEIVEKALEVGGVSEEDLMEFPSHQKVFRELTDVLEKRIDKFNKRDKLYFIAYNSPFDNDFLRQWFRKCGSNFFGSYFWAPDICVMRMAHQLATLGGYGMERGKMDNFKLGTVASAMGLDVDKEGLHDALVDIELTMEIYVKMLKLNVIDETKEKNDDK